MKEKIYRIRENIKNKKPLVHCITNPISINQCANLILAVGAKPIMAEHPKEVCDITRTADALMLNMGNITDARMEAFIISSESAKEKNIPVLLDAVGVACSRFRREYVWSLLEKNVPSVIKGNYSEIVALQNKYYHSKGVDAEAFADEEYIENMARELALKYETVILATGKNDIITDGEKAVYVKNGTAELSSVTGTGCMLGALCAAFMTTAKPFDAGVCACCYFGICGELSVTDKGNGSFMVNLMDQISTLSDDKIAERMNLEVK